jgi:hypothetical protein
VATPVLRLYRTTCAVLRYVPDGITLTKKHETCQPMSFFTASLSALPQSFAVTTYRLHDMTWT